MVKSIKGTLPKKIIATIVVLLFVINIPIALSEDKLNPANDSYTELYFTPNYEKISYMGSPIVNISLYVNLQANITIDTVGTDLIHFTPGVLRCREITWGNLFEDSIIRLDGTINNTAGTIRGMVWGSLIPTTKSGYYANFSFDVISTGYGTVTIDADPENTIVSYEMNPMPWVITHNFSAFSTPIIVSNEYPANRSANMPHNLLLDITLHHTLGQRMNMHWMSNATGIWKTIGIDNNLPNGSYDMSCYGVVDSPYNQTLTYTCTEYSSNIFHSNTCPVRDLGEIIQVRIYTPGYSGTIRPIFNGKNGSSYTVPSDKYTDITFDSIAPTQWQWSDIRDLDIYKISSSPTYIVLNYNIGFGDDVRVDWSVNVTDGTYWDNESYWYYTQLETPIISNPHPYDAQTWLTYHPTLSADIFDPNGDNMAVSFIYQNDTGSWIQIGSTQHGYNGTYSQPTTFATYNKTFQWAVVADDGHNHTANRTFRFTFREIQPAPIDFTAHTVCDSAINVSWIKPAYVDSTRVQRRPDHYPVSISDGLNIYNGTGNQIYDTEVLPGTIYYYRAWSWNNTDKTWSVTNSSVTETTAPSMVTDFNITTTSYNSTHLIWTKGVGALTTLIKRKIGSYPNNQSDGSLVYEGNGTSCNDTGLGSNITYFYRAWAHYDSGIFMPLYQNPDPKTGEGGICAESCSPGYVDEQFTIRTGQSFYATTMSLPLRTSRSGYVFCNVMLYGPGGLASH